MRPPSAPSGGPAASAWVWHPAQKDVHGATPEADLFFPVGTIGPALRQIDEAKRICRACPAQAACLAWAIDHGITSGVWGGTAEDERRALRRPAEKK